MHLRSFEWLSFGFSLNQQQWDIAMTKLDDYQKKDLLGLIEEELKTI